MFSRLVKGYISGHQLINEGDTVIVGLSGGADSVALLTVLNELGYNLIATHCNFHLRGEESDRDEQFCRRLCEKAAVRLEVRHFDVPGRQEATGESLEMACRGLRYEWWEEMLRENPGSVLAVGHHREDNIETFFINLLRGCGIGGLKGMLPRNGRIVRPLLARTRKEIEEYLGAKGIGYVTDSSNLKDDVNRNKIRLNILPAILGDFPDAEEAISRTIENLRGNYLLYREYTDSLREKYVDREGRIDVRSIIESSPDAVTALHELIAPLGLNATHAAGMVKTVATGGTEGKWFGKYLLDRGMLHTRPREEKEERQLIINHITGDEFRDLKRAGKLDKNALYLDSDTMSDKKITLRGWTEGDRISPFGMKGSKLVSDILSDAKISVADKKGVVIAECEGRILWVVGLRTSRHYPVGDSTRRVTVVTVSQA